MEEIIKILTTIVISIGALSAVIKWGIEKYFQKNEEVNKLKEKMTQDAIKSIQSTMDKVGSEMIHLRENMAELEGHMIIFHNRLNDYDSNNRKILNSYVNLTNDIKRKFESFENLETEILSDRTVIFRKRSH